ncbi:hypothetical protein KDK_19580 [Dictyobacter kobayashii]|uniref:Uncharacterized protein n=1 Tax=Dictyobacter kobayashii TaxID=2014872 RepID=A0A402AGA8_9CHLR|nr:hypothetical protein KDK_19580 [Dictyobacter kobayashii]
MEAAKRGCKGRRAPSLGTWDADFPVSSYGGRKAGMQGAASPLTGGPGAVPPFFPFNRAMPPQAALRD